jgi:uncharacterized membrane protein (UPF0127 family)
MISDIRKFPRLRFAASLVILTVFVAGCASSATLATQKLDIVTAGGQTVSLVAEIAITEAEQEKGYMKRVTIPDGTGMVFAYRQDQQMHFWMKDTPHALSIAFIASDGSIREIYDMKPFSLDVISSERSVRYALEVPAGWFSRAGIAVGDRLSPETLARIFGNTAAN